MSIKASARHNKTDRQLLRDALKKNAEMSDLLISLGAELDDDDSGETGDGDPLDVAAEEIDEGNPTQAVPVGTEVIAKSVDEEVLDMPTSTTFVKSISLDEMISNVRSSFYTAFRSMGSIYSESADNYPYIVSVYSDFVIVKCGMCYHKVPYTIGEDKVEFTGRTEWEKVEPDWVTKSVPNLDTVLRSVKSVGEDRLGMYLVMYGDEKNRDLGKEFFTKDTQDMLNVFKAIGKVPTLYHHGLDKDVKAEVVGVYDVMVQDEIGIWAETQLDKASKYKDAMIMLAEKGALGSSSGCLPTSRKVKKSGEIERWAIIEGSLTPTPMDYRQRLDTPVEVLKSIYKSVGLTFPENDDTQEPIQGDEESHESDESRKSKELEQMELEMIRIQYELEVLQ